MLCSQKRNACKGWRKGRVANIHKDDRLMLAVVANQPFKWIRVCRPIYCHFCLLSLMLLAEHTECKRHHSYLTFSICWKNFSIDKFPCQTFLSERQAVLLEWNNPEGLLALQEDKVCNKASRMQVIGSNSKNVSYYYGYFNLFQRCHSRDRSCSSC